MKYHALFVIFEKTAKFLIVVGGALRINSLDDHCAKSETPTEPWFVSYCYFVVVTQSILLHLA